MKIKTGIDAVEIERIEKAMTHNRFLKKILGPNEYKYYEKKGFPAESIAGAFCAKEAFSKAIGTGLRGFSMSEVEVMHDKHGRPYFAFSGKAKRYVRHHRLKFELSITHTRTTAFAVATAVKKRRFMLFFI